MSTECEYIKSIIKLKIICLPKCGYTGIRIIFYKYVNIFIQLFLSAYNRIYLIYNNSNFYNMRSWPAGEASSVCFFALTL